MGSLQMYSEYTIKKEEGFERLVDKISNYINGENRDYDTIAFVGREDDANEFLSEFVYKNKVVFGSLQFGELDPRHKDDEYLVSLTVYDGEILVYCEKFKVNGVYVVSDAEVVFIMDDCNSASLSGFDIPESRIFICSHEEDDDLDMLGESDNDMEGFYYTYVNKDGARCSKSFYSTDKDMVKKTYNDWIGGEY
jgi:hypothetical protein